MQKFKNIKNNKYLKCFYDKYDELWIRKKSINKIKNVKMLRKFG